MKRQTFGPLNGSAVGVILKEAARRAMVGARDQLREFEVHIKGVKPDGKTDVVTSVDFAAQEVYVRLLKDCFPHIGIVAEEKDLSTQSAPGYAHSFFTIDPIDGTKALERRQSHGIGTMVSFIWNGQVAAAFVGDVRTQELYGFRPDSKKVHRITDFEDAEQLKIRPQRRLNKQRVLVRENTLKLNAAIAKFLSKTFIDLDAESGSIGLSMARLWKGEVGGILLKPGPNHPWDVLPVVGISQKLGFVFLEIDLKTGKFSPYSYPVSTKTTERLKSQLVVHKSRLAEIGDRIK